MENGDLIKLKRKNRKISRKELSKNICSVNFLQRVENQNAKVDFETMLLLLDKMNIQMDEYIHELNSFSMTKKDKYRHQFILAVSNPDSTQIFLDQMTDEFEKTKDLFYLLLAIEMKLVCQKLPNHSDIIVSDKEISIVYNYLETLETWDYFELALYGNCLYIFSEKNLTFDLKDVLSRFNKTSSLPKHKRAELKFIVNYLIILFENGSLEMVPTLLDELYTQTTSSDYIKWRLYWKIFNELFLSLNKEILFDPTPIISLFRNLGYEEDVKNLEDIFISINTQNPLK
ncbi:Rgg family transcriptional regulator [Enterococcus diestrammenae]|uniref:Rgg family transcriptional regulator n=1 Tax=Enterococcus diestrammenae TaxID=1155073 RepID=UPI0019580261